MDSPQDSKLCNILFARELQRRLVAEGSAVTVNTFGPGLITRTGFFRNQQPLFVKVFDFFTNDVFHVAETVRAPKPASKAAARITEGMMTPRATGCGRCSEIRGRVHGEGRGLPCATYPSPRILFP